jgi:hypothetical protein
VANTNDGGVAGLGDGAVAEHANQRLSNGQVSGRLHNAKATESAIHASRREKRYQRT